MRGERFSAKFRDHVDDETILRLVAEEELRIQSDLGDRLYILEIVGNRSIGTAIALLEMLPEVEFAEEFPQRKLQ